MPVVHRADFLRAEVDEDGFDVAALLGRAGDAQGDAAGDVVAFR